MNPLHSSPSNPDGAAGVPATEHRRDLRRREIVDDGIALARVAGTLSALEYLKLHAIEGRIIARVLLDPARRRSGPDLAVA